MRALLQRVVSAQVSVNEEIIGKINHGWLVLLGVSISDDEHDVSYLVQKILRLRCFADENAKMNLDVQQVAGELLVVSQFTLYADCSRGNRPGFSDAALPQKADHLYQVFVEQMRKAGLNVATGKFGADMKSESDQ